MADDSEVDYRVSLRNAATNSSEVVSLVATPELSESRSVNYKTIDPVHAPGQILAYQSTASRTFSLSSVRLLSRTSDEAAKNLHILWLLRSWTMPQFGKSTLSDTQRENRAFTGPSLSTSGRNFGSERRGEPPAVLLLSAYSRGTTQTGNNAYAQHINRVPVVITSLNIPYPSDVDYIPAAGTNVPMPTIMTIDIQLTETHSPFEYENFSLSAFKSGTLGGF